MIYLAITKEDEPKTYLDSNENFKNRYNSNAFSFRHESHRYATTLSHHIWEINLGTKPDLKWEILDRAPAYHKGGKACQFCPTEKMQKNRYHRQHCVPEQALQIGPKMPAQGQIPPHCSQVGNKDTEERGMEGGGDMTKIHGNTHQRGTRQLHTGNYILRNNQQQITTINQIPSN